MMSEENKTSPEWTEIVKNAKLLGTSLKVGVMKLIDFDQKEIAKRNVAKEPESTSSESKQPSTQSATEAKKADDKAAAQAVHVAQAAQAAEQAKDSAKDAAQSAADSANIASDSKVAENDSESKK